MYNIILALLSFKVLLLQIVTCKIYCRNIDIVWSLIINFEMYENKHYSVKYEIPKLKVSLILHCL